MATSYDSIYVKFMSINKTPDIDLPSTDEGKYLLIKNGVDRYNVRMDTDVVCDDSTETVNADLNYWQIRIIALYMKYEITEGNRTYKTNLFTTFTKEIGIRNINSQLKSSSDSLMNTESLIDEIILNTDDEEYYGEV